MASHCDEAVPLLLPNVNRTLLVPHIEIAPMWFVLKDGQRQGSLIQAEYNSDESPAELFPTCFLGYSSLVFSIELLLFLRNPCAPRPHDSPLEHPKAIRAQWGWEICLHFEGLLL